MNDKKGWNIMAEEIQKDPHFAGKFIKEKLIQIAKESSQAGISVDEFEALVLALTDELDFTDIMNG